VGETDVLPLTAPPVENPLPTQLVALALPHSSVLDPVGAMVGGVAVRVAETAEPTVTLAVAGWLVAPPAPVHVIE
jgi:hypothetical protein